jgi:hypothetical protein
MQSTSLYSLTHFTQQNDLYAKQIVLSLFTQHNLSELTLRTLSRLTHFTHFTHPYSLYAVYTLLKSSYAALRKAKKITHLYAKGKYFTQALRGAA